MLESNIEFTGIRLTSSESKVISSNTDKEQTREGAGRQYAIERMESEVDGGSRELHDGVSDNAPTLVLAYLLQPNPASYALRTAQPLIPHLSLRANIPPSLPPAARQALEAIPQQFDRMLQEGFEPQRAVEAIVRAMFEGDAAEA
ncbi:hypothetical protein JCM10450v2_006655 [Rhodotorula kratochvilovae]